MMMRFLYAVVFIPLYCCRSALGNSGKYSKNVNSPSQREFRAQKINFLYEKAGRLLHSSELDNLWTELKHIDKMYMAAKLDHHDGKDTHGTSLKNSDKLLKQIAEKYGISEILASLDQFKKEKPSDSSLDQGQEPEFRDKKLHKLWSKAQEMNFSPDELKKLRVELEHYQEKLDDYESLLQDGGHHENSIHSELDEMKKESKRELKRINQEINDGIEKISKRVISGDKFKNKRVKFLWQQAIDSGFTGKELNELEEELRHFDMKLEKLRHIKESDHEFGMKDFKHINVAEKHVPTLEKYAQGVNKFEKYLQSKISHVDL